MSGSGGQTGYQYQANVTAHIYVLMLSRRTLEFFEAESGSRPIEVKAETGGPGDDIAVMLETGLIIEAQVKHNLKTGGPLREIFTSFGTGLIADPGLHCVLITDSDSSRAIRRELREDLDRLGQGRTDNLHSITHQIADAVGDMGNLSRAHVVELTPDARDCKARDVLDLEILFGKGKGLQVLDALRADANRLIARRGRRTRGLLLQYLKQSGFEQLPNIEPTLTSLPPPRSSLFVGRDKEISEIEKWFDGSDLGLVISGMPGMGKTSLASEVLKQRYKNVLWLAGDEPVEIHLRGAANEGQQCVVLDGLQGGSNGDRLLQLARRKFPRAKVIITTNDPGFASRTMMPGVVLEPSERTSIEILKKTIGAARYETDRTSLLRVVEAFQSHPMAIRQLALMLSDNPSLTGSGILAALPNFRTNLATNEDLSIVYQSCLLAFSPLSKEQKQALMRLSSFGERSFSSEVVRAACAIEPFGFTTALSRRGLLQSLGNGRWRLHTMVAQSVRAFAFKDHENFACVLEGQVGSNDFYAAILNQFVTEIEKPNLRREAVRRTYPELHNLLAIVDSVEQVRRTTRVVTGADVDQMTSSLIVRISLQLSYLSSEFWLPGLSQVLFRAVDFVGTSLDRRVVAAVLERAATCAFQEGRFVDAQAGFASAETVFRETGELRTLASLLNNWGVCLFEMGKHEMARERVEQALVINLQEKDNDAPRRSAANETNLGEICARQNDYVGARSHILRALAYDEDRSRPDVVERLGNLAIIELGLKNYSEAERLLAETFNRFVAMDYFVPGLLLLLDNAGRLHRDRGLRAIGMRYFMLATGYAQTVFAGHIYSSIIPRGKRFESLLEESTGDSATCECAVCNSVRPLWNKLSDFTSG